MENAYLCRVNDRHPLSIISIKHHDFYLLAKGFPPLANFLLLWGGG
jgi:hypothetical protein